MRGNYAEVFCSGMVLVINHYLELGYVIYGCQSSTLSSPPVCLSAENLMRLPRLCVVKKIGLITEWMDSKEGREIGSVEPACGSRFWGYTAKRKEEKKKHHSGIKDRECNAKTFAVIHFPFRIPVFIVCMISCKHEH